MALSYKFQVEKIIQEERVRRTDIQTIKSWIQTTPLPEIPDDFIVVFLLACKNDVTAAQGTICAYFRIKKGGHEIFVGRDIDNEDLRKHMDVIILSSLPKRMPNNVVIHFFKLKDTNYKNFNLAASIKLSFMLVDVSNQYNPPEEMVVVIDMQGAGFKHLTAFNFGVAKKYMEYMQEGMPLRIRIVHILNASTVFEKCLSLLKIFIKSELISKIIPHPPGLKMEEFYSHVPAAYLPREYGGELQSCEELNQITVEEFRGLKEFFEAEEDLMRRYNETK